MKNIYIYAILTIISAFQGMVFADVKIKTRQTTSGESSEYATYIKGKRERTEREMGDYETVSITQCDLHRDLQLVPKTKTYTVDDWQQDETTPTNDADAGKNSPVTKGGVITSTISTKDTGERKQMFGYTAKHLIVTTEMKSSPDACTKQDMKMVTDGWYIDAAFVFDCLTDRYKNYRSPYEAKRGGCQDRYETKQNGAAVKRGYAVYEKMTMFGADGKEISSVVSEVLEISNQTLDAALFDAPADYRLVKDSSELYASMASGSSYAEDSDDDSSNNRNSSGLGSSIKNMAANPTADSSAPTVGAKRAGVVRIGLAQVKTGAVGEGLNAQELAAAVQNTLSGYLKSPNVEFVLLEAKLPGAIDAEARQKECDYIIYAQVSHKKGGGGFGMFGKALGQVVSQTGGGAWGNPAANVAGGVAVNTITATTVSQNVKAKDEITLDVKLSKGGAPAFAGQYKQKAKGDGDDIISPVVEQAAQAILNAAK